MSAKEEDGSDENCVTFMRGRELRAKKTLTMRDVREKKLLWLSICDLIQLALPE